MGTPMLTRMVRMYVPASDQNVELSALKAFRLPVTPATRITVKR